MFSIFSGVKTLFQTPFLPNSLDEKLLEEIIIAVVHYTPKKILLFQEFLFEQTSSEKKKYIMVFF